MPPEGRTVTEDGLASHQAIMGYMGIGHKNVVVTNAGAPPTTTGTSINRHKLAKNVALANDNTRSLTPAFKILGNESY